MTSITLVVFYFWPFLPCSWCHARSHVLIRDSSHRTRYPHVPWDDILINVKCQRANVSSTFHFLLLPLLHPDNAAPSETKPTRRLVYFPGSSAKVHADSASRKQRGAIWQPNNRQRSASGTSLSTTAVFLPPLEGGVGSVIPRCKWNIASALDYVSF